MSDQSEQNRSEAPTSYKLKKARDKGTVARGTDLGFLSGLVAVVGCFWFSGDSLVNQVGQISQRALIVAPQVVTGPDKIFDVTGMILSAAFKPMSLIAAVVFLIVLLFELIQTGFVFSLEPLRPDFGRISPSKGLKRVFSLRIIIETIKNVLKFSVYVLISVFVILYIRGSLVESIAGAQTLANSMRMVAFRMLFMAIAAAALFAAIDQLIVRREFLKQMRMSRREVRRESRDREGDPRMKQRRRQLHGEFAKLSQSLRGIRGADILVTNPTHYAVALKYDVRTMVAPTIVSQGAHRFAARLRRLAFIYGVVVIENPPLARALYRLPLNSEIPESYFRSIADIYLDLRPRQKIQK